MVIGEASRFRMLAAEGDEAVRLGTQALEMAEALGLEELRAAVLNNIGAARAMAGDEERGLEDLRLAVEVARAAGAAFELSRALGNLASQLWAKGSLAEADRLWEEAHNVARQYGQAGFARWFVGIQVDKSYSLGNWDAALATANSFIEEIEAGSPHYLAPQAYLSRALVHLGRGEHENVLADAEQALTLARRAKDPQIVYLTLAGAAHAYRELGDVETAARLADEFVAALGSASALGFSVVWVHVLSWTGAAIGRGPELAEALLPYADVPWARAGIAFAEGRPAEAADVCAEMGAVTDEAYARLAAARAFAAEGNRVQADAQLRPALAFYRSVGATRYVREAESLLAASA